MARSPTWSRDEQLLAFRLYCRTPFGRLHSKNPDIIALAERIGRTPGAVVMKACNFASLDPAQQARGIRALGNVSNKDRELWAAFEENPERVAFEAEQAAARHLPFEPEALPNEVVEEELELPDGPTEQERLVRTRRVQRFFRDAVLVSYEQRCALSDLSVPELLVASHIIPWSADEHRRADPRNGLCLNALYDRAFDRGLIAFDGDLRVRVSPALECSDPPTFQRETLLSLEGRPLRLPVRFSPDMQAIAWHRQHIFRAS